MAAAGGQPDDFGDLDDDTRVVHRRPRDDTRLVPRRPDDETRLVPRRPRDETRLVPRRQADDATWVVPRPDPPDERTSVPSPHQPAAAPPGAVSSGPAPTREAVVPPAVGGGPLEGYGIRALPSHPPIRRTTPQPPPHRHPDRPARARRRARSTAPIVGLVVLSLLAVGAATAIIAALVGGS